MWLRVAVAELAMPTAPQQLRVLERRELADWYRQGGFPDEAQRVLKDQEHLRLLSSDVKAFLPDLALRLQHKNQKRSKFR